MGYYLQKFADEYPLNFIIPAIHSDILVGHSQYPTISVKETTISISIYPSLSISFVTGDSISKRPALKNLEFACLPATAGKLARRQTGILKFIKKEVIMKTSILNLLLLLVYITVSSQPGPMQCTIGVAHGSATQDGHPLVWQTMDWDISDWEVRYIDTYDYKFISAYDNYYTYYPAMGVNEHGLAAVRSLTFDLTPATSGHNAHQTMVFALGQCKTVDEFQEYLDTTNIIGRTHTCNIAMIDSTGAAAVFEVGGHEYWRFDAEDDPNGFIIRTNFTVNGGGTAGIQRFNRSSTLVEAFHSGDTLNHKSLIRYHMRDFSDAFSQPYPVPYPGQIHPGIPYGYIPTSYSICNHISVSTVVIQGVLPDEKPELSTLWAMLGQPAAAISAPYWPVGETPAYANGTPTAPLCDIAIMIREVLFDNPTYLNCINTYKLLDGEGGGLWTCTFPSEDLILDSASVLLNKWRNLDSIPFTEMLAAEYDLAEMAYNSLVECHSVITGNDPIVVMNEFDLYPNPVDDILNISVTIREEIDEIVIFSQMGQVLKEQRISDKRVDVSTLPEGIYIIELVGESQKIRKKFIKLSS